MEEYLVEDYLVEEYLEEEYVNEEYLKVEYLVQEYLEEEYPVEESLEEEYLENIFVRGSDHPVCYINRLPPQSHQQQSQYRYRFATSQYPISNNSYNLHNTILMHKMED